MKRKFKNVFKTDISSNENYTIFNFFGLDIVNYITELVSKSSVDL